MGKASSGSEVGGNWWEELGKSCRAWLLPDLLSAALGTTRELDLSLAYYTFGLDPRRKETSCGQEPGRKRVANRFLTKEEAGLLPSLSRDGCEPHRT